MKQLIRPPARDAVPPAPEATTSRADVVDESHPKASNAGPAAGVHQFVMCPPKYLSTRIPNNVWMKQEKVDVPRAMSQYKRIKNVIKALGTDVLEIPPVKGAQDQTYVANIGIAIEPYIIIANYKAPGREIEVEPARRFFEKLGYQVIQPPFDFEGEADLKRVNDHLYFGGWGQFTSPKALDWIEDKTGVEIVRLHEISKQLYHLDCSLFIIDEEHFLVTGAGIDKESIKTLEKFGEIIVTPKGIEPTGITNGLRLPDKRIFLSGTFNPELPDYRKAMEWLYETFDRFKYTVVLMDTDEADKSGADLSCMVFHLNFAPTGEPK